MSRASDLIEEHREIFERPEFRRTWPDARIRFDVSEEAWLAVADQDRLVVRRSLASDPSPDLVVSMSAGDFARHLTGEMDLFATLASPRPRMKLEYATGTTALRQSRSDLLQLAKSILSGLCLSRQCRPPFRGTVVEQLYMSGRSPTEEGDFLPMEEWSLPYYAGETLYRLVTCENLERTFEVGMAHGLSTIFIAQAHRDNGGGRHTAIDPCQSSDFSRCGVLNLRRAGLDDLVEVIEQPNYTALPGLLDAGADRFQLALIDGLHIFDHVMLDFFYSDRLLQVGGYVVFDDSGLPAVRAALNYILENRYESYERMASLSTGRLTVLKKVAEDTRVDTHGSTFHRCFASEGPAVVPMPPPRTPRLLKHAVDRTLALVALVALLPVSILILLAILLEDLLTGRGVSTPFHREPRISAGRRFDMIRFRTLGTSKGPDSPSRVGALLRSLHLDGLPLLWNVLSGRMSLVGPRPILLHDRGRRDIYRECEMRAGLTAAHRISGDEMSPIGGHGFEYYEDYVGRNQLSLLAFDLRILGRRLLRTLRSSSSSP